MNRHSGLKSILVSAVLVSLLSTTLLGIPGAQAELATPTAGSSSAPAAVEDQYCDSICPSIANSNGQLLGLTGAAGWTTADDQWCANHNSQTSPSVMASPAPLGATVPSGSCTIGYYPGDTSCAQVTAGFSRCQYKNSQVESYCEAYESAKMATGGEEMVMMLDIAATGVCAADCAMGGAGTVNIACEATSTAAGAAEIIVALTQQSSEMGKIADIALGGVGVALGVKGLKSAISSGGKCGKGASNHKMSVDEFVASLFIPEAEAIVPLKTPGSSCKKNACITAIAMAALTGVRYYNDGYGKRTKQAACNNIWALQSSATAIAGGITAAGYTASGGSTSGTSGSSVGSSGTTGGTTAATGLNCMANGGTVASCSNGQVSAATDGGLLNSGLGNAVLPQAQQLANSGVPAALGSGGGLGGAMGGALGGSDMGAALTKVAETAAANGKELGQVAAMTGGGGGGGGSASDTNALANMFGNSGPTAAAAPMAVFKGDGEDGDDIWHSHSSNNIFQIVSHRIGKVNP